MFSSAYIFFLMPKEWFNPNSFVFKEKKWEKEGRIYEKIFLIKRWKKLLPDGAATFKKGFRKKKLNATSKEYFSEFILESCRAEATHIPPIFLSFLFGLYNPPQIVLIMLIFAIIVNLPCILAQRYNRIRLSRIVRKLDDDGGNEPNSGNGQIMAYINDPEGRLCDWDFHEQSVIEYICPLITKVMFRHKCL